MAADAQNLDTYLHLHTLMQGFDKALARTKAGTKWSPLTEENNHGGLEGDGLPKNFEIETAEFRDVNGNERSVVLGRADADATEYYVWINEPPASRVAGHATIVHRDPIKRKFYAEHLGMRIYNDRFMYDHQNGAVTEYAHELHEPSAHTTSREVAVFATGTGKSYIIAHALKGLGGKGVVIVPSGMSKQMCADIKDVIPDHDIQNGTKIKGKADAIKAKLADFNGIIVIEADDLARFMGTDSNPGWLSSVAPNHVCIDEAHEFTISSTPGEQPAGIEKLERIAAHNNVLAVTATPNDALYDALGIADHEPAVSMTMYDAQHRLKDRAFRPLALELMQVGTPQSIKETTAEQREKINMTNEPAMRFEALAGYFGRDEYTAPDYCRPDPNAGWVKRSDWDERYLSAHSTLESNAERYRALPEPPSGTNAHANATIEAMEHNRVRYSQHANIAFAVRNALVKNLAHDYQSIHDGDYANLDALNQVVWKRRAQSAIAQYIKVYARDFGLPESFEDILNVQKLNILKISDKALLDGDNQQLYQEALRRIDPEMFRAELPLLFERLIGKPEDIDLAHEARDAAKAEACASQLRQFAAKELNISIKEARRLHITGQLESRLQQEGIKPPKFEPHLKYYALAITGNDPKTAKVYDPKTGEQLLLTGDDVTAMVRNGEVMHAVNNHLFTTGFSDPDVMMSQRIIENNGDYIVRGTQILGRPIREKDGVAALQEIVGPCINLHGELGVDRHFSCYDVTSKHYLERVKEFSGNWQSEGQQLWRPSTAITGHALAEAVTPGQERGVA